MAEKEQNKSVDQLHMQQKRKCDDILNRNCRRKLFTESSCSTPPIINVTSQNIDQDVLHTDTSLMQNEISASDILTGNPTKIPKCGGSSSFSYCEELSSATKTNNNVNKSAAANSCTENQKDPLHIGIGGSGKYVCSTSNEHWSEDSSKEVIDSVCNCVCTCCHNVFVRNLCVLFKSHNYDFNNSVVSEALAKQIRYKHVAQKELICRDCHNALRRRKTTGHKPQMPVNAVASPLKYISKKSEYSCKRDKVSDLTDFCTKSVAAATHGTSIECDKSCDLYVCTCCHDTFQKVMCILFSEENYNFNDPVVCKTLSMDIRYKAPNREEHICKSCHRQLCKNTSMPIMPCQAVASPHKGSFNCLSCGNLHEK